jgi:hypothetical protein
VETKERLPRAMAGPDWRFYNAAAENGADWRPLQLFLWNYITSTVTIWKYNALGSPLARDQFDHAGPCCRPAPSHPIDASKK